MKQVIFKLTVVLLFLFSSTFIVHSAQIEKGPYLMYMGNNTQMKVMWQLDGADTCTLEWGTSTSYSDGSVQTTAYGSDYQHTHVIPNLSNSTKYYYRVSFGSSSLTGSFRSAPANSEQNLKFFAYGDTRSNPSDHDAVANQMITTFTNDPAYQTITLHSGDWANSNSESSWSNEFFPRSYSNIIGMQSQLPVQGCRGNHESNGAVLGKYYPFPYVNDFYWSYDYGPIHVVNVDIYVNYSSGSTQYNWLANDLSSTTKQWKIVVFHGPAWSAGGGHSNNTTAQSQLQPLFVQHGVSLVINGDNHYYSRCVVEDVQHITTGGGGAPLYTPNTGAQYLVASNKSNHHCEIDIQGNSLNFLARNRSGTVIDSFELIKGPVVPVAAFTADTTSASTGQSINFTDQSTGTPTSWSWDFGDSGTSTLQNPSHSYSAGGTYTVTLTVSNSAGNDTETKTDYITVTVPQPPVANFSANATNIEVGNTVTFTDQSSYNPTSWSWSFPGGTPTNSTVQNPSVTYSTAGTYDVSLTVTNSSGSDNEVKTGYLNVTAPLPTVGHTELFTSNSTSANRRAMPFTMSETSNISSVTMYHLGGSGSMILAVYDGTASTPGNRIAVTPTTAVSANTGWQTISLSSPVTVQNGATIWLAWVYETNPGIAYQTGTPGRVDAGVAWSGGMPVSFGSGTAADYLYSIYASYSPATTTQYTLTTNTTGQGSVSLSPAGGTYNEGTVVTLTPQASSGWQFSGWSGDLGGSDNPATITMNSNKTVTATFTEVVVPQYTLTTNVVGQGSVTLSPSGGTYDENTVVTLTPQASSGWQFSGWSGDLNGSANPGTITMNANKTVTATFTETGSSATVGFTEVFGQNTTTANRRSMPFSMPENGTISSVSMYHTGGSGEMLMGIYDGEGSPANRIAVTASTTVSSTTGWQTINLVSPVFVQGGTTVWLTWVYETNPGIHYQSGTPGRADAGEAWSGGMPTTFGSSTQADYTYSIYATYTPGGTPPQYNLTTNTVGQGSVSASPAGGTYDAGTVVTLTATADSGWQFANWSGDLSGSTNPATITMNSAKNVTATFTEIGATATVGITEVHTSNYTGSNRRSMPFVMSENGTITSISMYHKGGSGSMILAVYDGESEPTNRIGITATETVTSSDGWQTLNLTTPVAVQSGATVWLTWVYETNPGVAYISGSPGRADAGTGWSSGMPATFGSSSRADFLYSIYATYTTGAAPVKKSSRAVKE